MATKAKLPEMVTLTDLPDMPHKVRAVDVQTRTEAARWLVQGKAVTAAGDSGAVNLWRDRHGMYRCEFYRFRLTADSSMFGTLSAVRKWLREWWPKMGSPRPLADRGP